MCDVFSFGVVLICLISKRTQTETNQETSHEPFLYEWAHNEYHTKSSGIKLVPFEFSLVHKSLETQPFFCARDGVALTKLAMQCIDYNPKKRPTMKQIFSCMQKLFAVKNNAPILSLENMKAVRRLSVSELRRLMIKNIKVSLDWKEKASRTLFKYMASEDKLVTACKDRKYDAPDRLSFEDIKCYTHGFSKDNFIDMYPFGKLYHGSIDSRKVTVKTWEDVDTHYIEEGDNEIRLRDELILLQHPKFVSHPHIVKMIGYCYEDEKLSAVYNLESKDILFNLISKDGFTWYRRIIFIFELAELLKYLQQRNPPYLPYVLRNISPDTILVDIHYKPKLFDFGMLLGGIMKDQQHYRVRHVHAWDYFTDPYTNCYDYYTEVSDIYSFGMIILNLITRICYLDSEIEFDEWVRNEFQRAQSESDQHFRHFSLVDNKFHNEVDFDPCDGQRLTKLAMQCIDCDYSKRPTIKHVVKQLKNLKVIRMGGNSS